MLAPDKGKRNQRSVMNSALPPPLELRQGPLPLLVAVSHKQYGTGS
jgi:hypothetical protein